MSDFLEFLLKKDRPFTSVIFFFLSGVLLVISFISNYLPCKFTIEFLDNIVWENNLKNGEFIIVITFLSIISYGITNFCMALILSIKKNIVLSENNWNKYNELSAKLHAITDVVELLCSVLCLVSLTLVFIQQYKTGRFYDAPVIHGIYLFVSWKSLNFLWYRCYAKNRKIFCNSSSKLNDEKTP